MVTALVLGPVVVSEVRNSTIYSIALNTNDGPSKQIAQPTKTKSFVLQAKQQIYEGNLEQALGVLSNLANQGDGDALFVLGDLYAQGDYVIRDFEAARSLFQRALDAGSVEALYGLGWLHWDDAQGENEKAKDYFSKAIARGHGRAYDPYSLILGEDHPEFEPSRNKYLDWLREYETSDMQVAYELAYANEWWESEDGQIQFKELVDQGYPNAEVDHAWRLVMSETHEDEDETIRLFVSALRKGFRPAAYLLVILRNTQFLSVEKIDSALSPKDTEKIREYFNAYDTDTFPYYGEYHENYLAQLFRTGESKFGIKPSYERSFQHMQDCVEAGVDVDVDGFCTNWLAIYYSLGIGVGMDHEKAIELFKQAFDRGSTLAAGNIGEAYVRGEGVKIDYEEARRWLELAIKDSRSFYTDLGDLYLEGLGVDSDPKKAEEYYREALLDPEWLDPDSAIKLARLLETGAKGVKQNLPEALYWFEIAAKDNPTYEKSVFGERERNYKPFAAAQVKRLKARIERLKLAGSGQALEFGEYHALLIGVSDYAELTDLKTPVEDVRMIGELLGRRYGFSVRYLINATRSEILSTLNFYRRELGERDNFLIYFAGHGVRDEELGIGYWQAEDSTEQDDFSWIETDRVVRVLRSLKSRNAMVIADSCFAGTVFRGDLGNQHTKLNSEVLKRLIEEKSRVAMTSGSLQPVPDSLDGASNSVFAQSLAYELGNLTEPLSASSLFTVVRDQVLQRTLEKGVDQDPQFAPLFRSGHEGGDFVFNPLANEVLQINSSPPNN